MKNKQIQSVFIPIFFLCFCLAFIALGCLGLGDKGGGGVSSVINPKSSLSISGRAYFYERQIYGNIPIVVKNFQKEIVAITTTDSGGYYSFSNINPGIYYVSATTGESEVTFGNPIQVTDSGATELSSTALLCIKNVTIDKISSDSFHIDFHTNRSCRATLEYGPTGGYLRTKTLGQAGQTHHETTITGLNFLTEYEISIHLTGDDGQEFVMNGLNVATIGLAGSSNLAVNINQGAYETNNRIVTLNMEADDCQQMRISENYTMDGANWITYSPTYSHTFSNTSSGIKRIYVQFKSQSGTLSPIESDSIIYTTSGYAGIWINDGEAVTNQPSVMVKIVYPGAVQMMISDNPNFTNSYWEAYFSSRKWTFNSINGLKSIYCRFKGGTANPDEVFKASILYDTTPPSVELLINNGATVTATTSVKLWFASNNIPAQMKVNNSAAPSESQDWVTFKSELDWTLPSGDGAKTVYAVFKDNANNIYGPIAAGINLDTVAPTGNSITVLTTDSSTSEVATFSLIDDLPKYLHFTIADNTTYKAYYFVGPATTTLPTSYLELSSPFSPVELSMSNLTLGDNKIWVYYADEAGNAGFIQTTNLRVEGPEITITPALVDLTTDQHQTFIAKLKNITQEQTGDIKWTVASGSGHIDSTGIYAAPSPIYREERVVVKGESALKQGLYGLANINLKTSVELTYLQNNGKYTKEPLEKQIMPGETVKYQVYVLHSPNGIRLTTPPSIGITDLSTAVPAEFGSIATVTYTAPSSLTDVTTVNIGISADDSSSVTGNLRCVISTGANISITKSANIAQRNLPVTLTANISNTALQSLTWKISPTTSGSFSPNSSLTTTTTQNPNHEVTFYPGTPNKISYASITAEIGDASKSVRLAIYPPLSITIDPIATHAMPIVEPMLFNVNSFEYMISGTDEGLTWQFKNENSADFMPADGKQYADRGSLTVVSNTQVRYQRPSKLPSSTDDTASDNILIRAFSNADPQASSTATVSLVEKVSVKIYDNVEKTHEITEVATVIEVGTLQFYANVTPNVIGNTSVTWTVNGVNSSELYGSIDSNGKYTAPNFIDTNQVRVRATSKYDPNAYAEVKVNLNEFWVPKRDNLVDQNTGEPMPISSIFVDKNTAVGEDFVVYAGTGAENKSGYYGMWVATFSDEIGNTSGGYWQGIPGLSSSIKSPAEELLIYAIAMSPNRNLYASTGKGLYYVPSYGSYPNTATKLTGVNSTIEHAMPRDPIFSIDIAMNSSGKTQILGGCNDGVYIFTLSNTATVEQVELLIDTQSKYYTLETRTETVTVGSETATIAHSAYCNDDAAAPNPISSVVRSVFYDSMNKSLYFGTASNMIYHCPSLQPNMIKFNNQKFAAPAPSLVKIDALIREYIDLAYPKPGPLDGIPLVIALDVINTNTLWCATTRGVARSIDYGTNWTNLPFTNGINTNCRSILVDPNNTINVMSGSEDGLYRSTDGGENWTRIKSGLGNYKTITCLTQAAGAAGKRRKVWIGTSGGVFLGKQSLALE